MISIGRCGACFDYDRPDQYETTRDQRLFQKRGEPSARHAARPRSRIRGARAPSLLPPSAALLWGHHARQPLGQSNVRPICHRWALGRHLRRPNVPVRTFSFNLKEAMLHGPPRTRSLLSSSRISRSSSSDRTVLFLTLCSNLTGPASTDFDAYNSETLQHISFILPDGRDDGAAAGALAPNGTGYMIYVGGGNSCVAAAQFRIAYIADRSCSSRSLLVGRHST